MCAPPDTYIQHSVRLSSYFESGSFSLVVSFDCCRCSGFDRPYRIHIHSSFTVYQTQFARIESFHVFERKSQSIKSVCRIPSHHVHAREGRENIHTWEGIAISVRWVDLHRSPCSWTAGMSMESRNGPVATLGSVSIPMVASTEHHQRQTTIGGRIIVIAPCCWVFKACSSPYGRTSSRVTYWVVTCGPHSKAIWLICTLYDD